MIPSTPTKDNPKPQTAALKRAEATLRTPYPKRPRFYANRVIRLMTKTTLAQTEGTNVFTLLAVIVMTEDARGYDGPVTFYNSQLAPLIGANSIDSLDRTRKKAVASGWLEYTPGFNRRPAAYRVVIPEAHRTADDAPTDEGKFRTGAEDCAEVTPVKFRTGAEHPAEHPAEDCAEDCAERSAEPPYLSLSLTQYPPTPVPGECGGADEPKTRKPRKSTQGEHPLFARFYAAYPRKENRPAASRAFAKLNPDEQLLGTLLEAIDRQQRRGCLEPRTTPDGRSTIPHPASWLTGRRWEDSAPETNGKPHVPQRPLLDAPNAAPMFGRKEVTS